MGIDMDNLTLIYRLCVAARGMRASGCPRLAPSQIGVTLRPFCAPNFSVRIDEYSLELPCGSWLFHPVPYPSCAPSHQLHILTSRSIAAYRCTVRYVSVSRHGQEWVLPRSLPFFYVFGGQGGHVQSFLIGLKWLN